MNPQDYHPLIADIEDGDVAAVESFLQTLDIDVDFIFEVEDEGDRYTPLNWAIRHNQKAIVEVRLAHGAAANGPVGADKTPLQMACDRWTASEDIVNLLLEHGADVDAMTAEVRQTPLTLACMKDSNLGIAQLLLDAGADVDGGGGEYEPLHWAAYYGNIEVIELFIEAGADVNRVSTNDFNVYVPAGSTPLHGAVFQAQLGSLTTLLAAGADPNIANANGRTPLHEVAWSSSVDVLKALLAAGCDPLHRDNQGRTPLQYLYEARCNRGFSAEHFNAISTLVAAGDRSWECVPTPCPGLEAAMVSVWQAAPDELPELVKRLDGEMKKVVQEVLRVLHHHFSGFPHLKEHLLNSIFGLKTSV